MNSRDLTNDTITTARQCPECGGAGYERNEKNPELDIRCGRCGGVGYVSCEERLGSIVQQLREENRMLRVEVKRLAREQENRLALLRLQVEANRDEIINTNNVTVVVFDEDDTVREAERRGEAMSDAARKLMHACLSPLVDK